MRLEVLPALERAKPGAAAALLRAAGEAREAVSALEAIAARAIVAGDDDAVTLSRATLQSMPPAVVPYACRLAVERLLGDARELDRRHYAVLAGAAFARTGTVFELPRGLEATVDADAVVLSVGPPAVAAIPSRFEAPLPFDGVAGAWRLRVVRAAGDAPDVVLAPESAVVRGRHPGDRIRLPGGRKKLQDLLVDLKVPRRQREELPIIAVGAEVLWTPFATAAACQEGRGRWRVVAARTDGRSER